MKIPTTLTAYHLAVIFLLPALLAILIGICNDVSAAYAAKNARRQAAEQARRKAAIKAEETARKKGEAEQRAAEKKRIAAEKAAAREAERERIAQQRHENAMKRAEEMHALRLRQANELKAVRAESKAVVKAKQVAPAEEKPAPGAKEKATPAVKEEQPVIPTPVAAKQPKSGASKPFDGESVAFTGTCPKLDRRAMITHTNRLGGHGYETINTRCTLLVVGEKPGKNQLERAAKWNVKQITWQEWYKRAFGEASLPTPKPVKGMTLDEFANTLDAA